MNAQLKFSLSQRRALVTGSVRGLGLEMARSLGQAGASVVLNGREPVALEDAAAKLRADGLEVTAAAFDVTDLSAASEAVAALGQIDILVNNVGQRDRRGLTELSPDDFRRMLNVHLTSTYALSQSVARNLVDRGLPGRIVNV
jgi:gluconate 5-dehydrogenase